MKWKLRTKNFAEFAVNEQKKIKESKILEGIKIWTKFSEKSLSSINERNFPVKVKDC